MTTFAVSLQALAPLFVIIVLGYGLKRARLLHPAHVPVLNGIVLSVTMPALVLHGLAHASHLEPAYAKPIFAMLAVEATLLLAGLAICKMLRLGKSVTGAVLMVSAFGNTGFLGYPITLALMSKQFPLGILIDQFSMTVPLYITGAMLGAVYGSHREGGATPLQMIGRFLRSPLFISMILGVAIHAVALPHAISSQPEIRALGSIVDKCLELLGQGTTPIVLLGFGVALRAGAFRSNVAAAAVAVILKLAVSPVAIWGVCLLLHLPTEMRREAVLLGSMPTAVMASVLCAQNDLEGDMAVGIVFLTTILSAISVPLMLTLLH